MDYKETVKHHTHLIKDQNKWEVIKTSDLDENDKDAYCIGCGMDEQDGTYKYHRTVANGDEWYCTNCKEYHLH